MAVSTDTAENSRAFRDRYRLAFPLLRDADTKIAVTYGVAMETREVAIPSIFLLDRNGVIRWQYIGETMADRPRSADIAKMLRKFKTE